jgi:hypothetical protein
VADHIFESATARLQRELDPKYRVVFDDHDQMYYVLRWRQTGCDQGYYAVQGMGFQTWDEDRIIEYFRHGHWRTEHMSDAEFDQERTEDHEKVDKEQDAVLDGATHELGKDLLDYYHAPVIRSIPGIIPTRLQE